MSLFFFLSFHFFNQPESNSSINYFKGTSFMFFCTKKSRLVLQRKWQPEIRPEIHHVEVGRYIVEIHHDLRGVFVSFQVVGAGFLNISERSTRSFAVFYQHTQKQVGRFHLGGSLHWTPSAPWHQSSPQLQWWWVFEPIVIHGVTWGLLSTAENKWVSLGLFHPYKWRYFIIFRVD